MRVSRSHLISAVELGATVKLRNVTRLVSPGQLVSEEYFTTKDAPEVLLVSVEAKKR
jgi:hypothetical protein